VKLLRRSEMQESSAPRREDALEVFVRYLEAAPGQWVAEADAPPTRAQGQSLHETRRRMAAALALRMGAGALEAATVIEDLPEEAEDAEDQDYAGGPAEGLEDEQGEEDV
jgi:hypothetical protein